MCKRLLHILSVLIVTAIAFPTLTKAEIEDTDTAELNKLYTEFLALYRSGENDEAFYEAAEALGDLYKRQKRLDKYYTMQLNICLYDTEHDKPYKALKRAYEMMEEMKAGQTDAYDNVYMALGTVYESRGNYRMARHYYEETLNYTDHKVSSNLMSIQSRLAFLLMFTSPEEAWKYNEMYRETCQDFPEYHQVYLFIRGVVQFMQDKRQDFLKTYNEYFLYKTQEKPADNYGGETLEIIKLVLDQQYDSAISRLQTTKNDLSPIGRQDLLIRIYEVMGNTGKALEVSRRRAEIVDSLNSDMLFNNLNEINAQTGLYRANMEASKAHTQTFHAIILLSLLIICILTVWLFMYRKTKQHLKQKNEQLRAALSMAEEGEKMKTEFVRSVSHEIRTPLNAINGFNDILNTPGIELSAEERADILNRIKENVQAITNIVDEMLHMADKESNEFYPKSNTIYCNQFFAAQLYEHRDHVSASIELNYTTRVINRFQIESNEEGLRKIMEHLIQNAIKFTSKGFINVHCEQSDDKKWLLVSVTDTGCGIDKKKKDKIFEGFYKADTFQQGIGLGLTVSKKIAKKLGGDLVLDEDYTSGARFVLSLPI